MDKKILVINAGSSSIKFKVYDYEKLTALASGLCERIFIDGHISTTNLINKQKIDKKIAMPDHAKAAQIALDVLKKLEVIKTYDEIVGIGHRVAMGGDAFKKSTSIDDEKNLTLVGEYGKIAPLHNLPERDVVLVFKKLIPKAKNVGVFDTSFHTTMPQKNYDYTLPRNITNKYKIRRYGFHGTSYSYVTKKMQQILHKKAPNLIICHIGNGASICCVKNGKSYDTTMGFSPLAGLVMGTRCGDIDASVALFLLRQKYSVQEADDFLNKKAGLLGLCGFSDTRDVCQKASEKNQAAILARQIQVQRIANYIVQYINELDNKVDAIVFTAGCGENDGDLPIEVADQIKIVKLKIDSNKTCAKYDDFIKVSKLFSKIKVYKVHTNEELLIASDTKQIIG